MPVPAFAFLVFALAALPLPGAGPASPWETPFLPDAAALRAAADARPEPEDVDAEILFKEAAYTCDAAGRCTFRERTVIRILSESAVEDWAEISREWAPWFEEKPELRARVIAKGGTVSPLGLDRARTRAGRRSRGNEPAKGRRD